jgi:anti-sigma factor RsiW
MSCDRYIDVIADLVDGTLPDPAQAEVRAHLDGCPACRELAADLREIRRIAGTLEVTPPPPRVWARISSGLEIRRTRRWFPDARWLAAAATLVLIAGVSALWMARTGTPTSEPAPAAAAAPTAAAGNAPVGDLVERIEGELKLAEQHYQAALADLDRIAANDGSALDPAVTAALRDNVALVDRAIADSRAALETDPQSVPARESLFDALRRKVTLLQDTIALVGEMSRGNQAGTAAIVEGLKKS